MILKEILKHFEINVVLPDYLLDESFNEVFLKGSLVEKNDTYEIITETQKKVTHTMIISLVDDFPVKIISRLPNGTLNGVKFGCKKGDISYNII